MKTKQMNNNFRNIIDFLEERKNCTENMPGTLRLYSDEEIIERVKKNGREAARNERLTPKTNTLNEVKQTPVNV